MRSPPASAESGCAAAPLMDTSLTLRHVRAFLAVAECCSVTEASRRLHITQSGLSRVIQELEAGLGTKAFERRAGGMRLTAAGQAFEPHARRIAACYVAAVEVVRPNPTRLD